MRGHPNFDENNIVRLSALNSKIWGIYQATKRVNISGFFEFTYNAYFPKTDPLEMQYFVHAMIKIDELYNYYQQVKAEKQQYYEKLKAHGSNT